MNGRLPRRKGVSRRTALLVGLAEAASLIWAGAEAAADNPYDPAQTGKQHSIVKGKNVQPTEPHVRKRLERKRQRRGQKARKEATQPQKPE